MLKKCYDDWQASLRNANATLSMSLGALLNEPVRAQKR